VDIPSLEFIVFLRPVKSRILWVQMLGRGTRKCPDINKEKFTIFDCFDGTLIEYFKNTTDFKIELPQKDPISLEQVIENIYQNVDRDYFIKVLMKRLLRINRSMSGEAREKFAAYIPDGDIGKFANGLPKSLKKDFAKTMKLLRDKGFQDLLVHYPRAKKSFVVAYEQDDDVSSDVMIHVGGDYQKPEDYLDSFTKFVRKNANQIAALQILLKRPRDWQTDVLEDLRQKLARENFPEKELRKAHKLVYDKALADIISMVKHAAVKEAPLLSAEERVEKALEKVTAGKTFNEEQQKWLTYIREHLVENLTIDMDDFDIMPVFERHGGLGVAKKVFQDQLETLVREINFEIAA
jgi:type I restriction enzyme R subunit